MDKENTEYTHTHTQWNTTHQLKNGIVICKNMDGNEGHCVK